MTKVEESNEIKATAFCRIYEYIQRSFRRRPIPFFFKKSPEIRQNHVHFRKKQTNYEETIIAGEL